MFIVWIFRAHIKMRKQNKAMCVCAVRAVGARVWYKNFEICLSFKGYCRRRTTIYCRQRVSLYNMLEKIFKFQFMRKWCRVEQRTFFGCRTQETYIFLQRMIYILLLLFNIRQFHIHIDKQINLPNAWEKCFFFVAKYPRAK